MMTLSKLRASIANARAVTYARKCAKSDALMDLASQALLRDCSDALLAGRFAIARMLTDAMWTMAHARAARERGDTNTWQACMRRAANLALEIEAIESGNAVIHAPCHAGARKAA